LEIRRFGESRPVGSNPITTAILCLIGYETGLKKKNLR